MNIEDIKHALLVKRQEYERAKVACDILFKECEVLEAAIPILESVNANSVCVTPASRGDSAYIDLSRLPGLPNMYERLKCLAEMNDGIINVTKSVEALISSGASNAKKNNLRPNVYNMLKDDPDWERIEPGTFKYLKHPGLQQLLPEEDQCLPPIGPPTS